VTVLDQRIDRSPVQRLLRAPVDIKQHLVAPCEPFDARRQYYPGRLEPLGTCEMAKRNLCYHLVVSA
jgi:hypothetical protein